MDGYVRDYRRGDADGVHVWMGHDPHAYLKPQYEICLPNGGRCLLMIEDLRVLRTVLNDHMEAIERHAASYSRP